MFRICQVKAARASLSLPSFESEIDACQLFFFLPHHPFTDFFSTDNPYPSPYNIRYAGRGRERSVWEASRLEEEGEVCLPLRISHIQSAVPRDSSSSSSSRAVVEEEEEEEKQEQVVVGREEIFLLPPFPCLLPPLSIHRLRPSPSLVFFPESKQGREVFLSPSRWKRGKWVADLGGGERSKVKAEEAALKKEVKKQTSLLSRRLLQGNGGGARRKSPFSSTSVTLLPVCAWRGKKLPRDWREMKAGERGKHGSPP